MYFGCKKEQYYEREMQIAGLHDREREHCIKKFYKNLLHFFIIDTWICNVYSNMMGLLIALLYSSLRTVDFTILLLSSLLLFILV